MQRIGGATLYSATDVANFLECEHLAALDFAALGDDALRASKSARDESAELFAKKGDAHERAHLERLRAQGLSIADIAAEGGSLDDKVARTLDAMRSGVQVVYQAALRDGVLAGHADFLRRVDGESSAFGAWRYEVADTKLARSPKAKFLVQLAFYSHLLASAQGVEPRQMHVVLGDHSERAYRSADYLRYFRSLLDRFLASVQALAQGSAGAVYPVPCEHCALCDWRERCAAQRIADDHLCQVAGISRAQWGKLQDAGIDTMARLASLSPESAVARIQPDTLAKLRSQAALQDEARRTGRRRAIVLPPDAERRRGFHRLPLLDEGDLFFDMEGDPLESDGLEYLFGVGFVEGGAWRFRGFWAHGRAEERRAFEQFMDFVVARRRRHPGAHVYHYASYEESALKRLASLHATREVEVDELLRQEVLVDLYKVVREGIRISEDSYSIKAVERFYRPARAGDVKDAGASIVAYERWRETGEAQLLRDIEAYNRDDVESTRQLRDWLLSLRPAGMPWKPAGSAAAGEERAEGEPTRAQKAEARLVPYRERLVDALPANTAQWTTGQRVSELTWQLLDFHRRAAKPAWWAMYERMDKDDDELLDDPECLARLEPDPAHPPQKVKQSIRYSYLVPEQESKLKHGDACTRTDTGQALGQLDFDAAARRVRLKVGPTKQPLPARLSIGPGLPIGADGLVDALYRFADSSIAGDGRYAALERMLKREAPRLKGHAAGRPIVVPGADPIEGCLAAVEALDASHLYVQGPPGAGKTRTGSHMIVHLLAQGRRIGITSNSHKAIDHLLAAVMKLAEAKGLPIRAVKKATAQRPDTEYRGPGAVQNVTSNGDVWACDAQLVAGTAWAFADAAADQRLDHLFIDEAGQVALANLVAAGTASRNLVLLGDQMQLAQPVQGVHPGRSGDSALDYLLDGAATIAAERGIFLGTTWRMHPDVCRFISEAVYDGRLEAEPHNARQRLVLGAEAHPLLRATGIVHAPIEHAGCAQRSEAEAELVRAVYASALRQHHIDRDGALHAMSAHNILVVAPYNMQVNWLQRILPDGARVGTVDRFQGQEAELVIVSMTTSSEHDLPRFMEFLYSRNRLNVAISRTRCTAIVIANPALLAIRCRTPEQMALVNTLCWVAEAGRR